MSVQRSPMQSSLMQTWVSRELVMAWALEQARVVES